MWGTGWESRCSWTSRRNTRTKTGARSLSQCERIFGKTATNGNDGTWSGHSCRRSWAAHNDDPEDHVMYRLIQIVLLTLVVVTTGCQVTSGPTRELWTRQGPDGPEQCNRLDKNRVHCTTHPGTLPNGIVGYGVYKFGKKDGLWGYHLPNGTKRNGLWQSGKRVGDWSWYDAAARSKRAPAPTRTASTGSGAASTAAGAQTGPVGGGAQSAETNESAHKRCEEARAYFKWELNATADEVKKRGRTWEARVSHVRQALQGTKFKDQRGCLERRNTRPLPSWRLPRLSCTPGFRQRMQLSHPLGKLPCGGRPNNAGGRAQNRQEPPE